MNVPYEALVPFEVALAVLFLLVCIPWILLPFAVFGIKRRIDRATQAVYEIGILLQKRLPPPAGPGENIHVHDQDEGDIFSAWKR